MWGTIFVAVLLVVLICGIIWKLYHDHKQGKSSCGGNCAGCSAHGMCHPEKNKNF